METRYCNYCQTEHLLTSEFWYRLEASPRCKKQVKKKRERNYDPERASEYNKQYREKNREYLDLKNAEWRNANAERHRENARKWYAANAEHAQIRMQKYRKQRRKVDLEFKLACNLRGRMYRVMRGINKVGSAVADLGCSLPELCVHLEQLFQPGMSWDSYGVTWEVDHILPLANYQLSDRGTYRRLAHYTNLQPLWIDQNRRKSNKENLSTS